MQEKRLAKEEILSKNSNERRKNIHIGFLVVGILILIVGILGIFIYSRQKVNLEILEYETDWTNQSVLLTVKKVDNALYSFNQEDYSASNTYEVNENMKNLFIRMRIGKKEYEKQISISNIDKEPPIINQAILNNQQIQVDAIDHLSGIKGYVYIIDGIEYTSKKNVFVLDKDTRDIVIKAFDHAGNSTVLPKSYFDNEELSYTLSAESWTNQNIIVTIVRKPEYSAYSFSMNSDSVNYQSDNSFEVPTNGMLHLSVKTKGGKEVKKSIEIQNIDKVKPKVSYQIDNGTVKIVATDNSGDPLLYSWNGEKYGSSSEKKYQKDSKNQIVKVKDCASNIAMISFDVILPKSSSMENNQSSNNQNDSKPKPTPTPTKSTSTKPPESAKPSTPDPKPTFEIQYSETGPTTKPIVITVITDASNLVSFQGGAWTSNQSITISENVENYKIRVKNKIGTISEKTIQITNIVKEKTTKEKNQDMIAGIQNTYGFKVSYGDGTYCYYAGSSCTPLYNEEKANIALTKITNLLKNFPTDFFRKFQGNNGYQIILFDDIPGNTQGVTSYEIGNDNQLFLDVNNDLLLERVVYHETWHFMEQLIMIKNNYNNPFDHSWDHLNPTSFSYPGDSSNNYTPYDPGRYSPGFPKGNIAFISAYGKSSAREDRAEIFADLMFRGYKQNYMQAGYGINEKAKAMMHEVRKVWPNSPSATWEKYITW